jgi:hypothetical protein
MKQQIGERLEACVQKLNDGRLTAQDLSSVLDGIDDARQELLYLQAHSTAVTSEALGMLLVVDGQVDDGPSDPEQWPYRSVLEAMRDGWRVISFPNMALLALDDRTYGLGCEFVLERWR